MLSLKASSEPKPDVGFSSPERIQPPGSNSHNGFGRGSPQSASRLDSNPGNFKADGFIRRPISCSIL